MKDELIVTRGLGGLIKFWTPFIAIIVTASMGWARLNAQIEGVQTQVKQTQQTLQLKAPLDIANDITELKEDMEDVQDTVQDIRIQVNTLCTLNPDCRGR